MEQAAKYDILEAASLRLPIAGLLPLTAELDKKYCQGSFNRRNDSRILLDGNRIISIKNNSKVYCESLCRTMQHANGQQKKRLLCALKMLADSGWPAAMEGYAMRCDSPEEKDIYLRKAFAMNEPSAIRTLLLSKKIKWESLNLASQLAYAETYPMAFAGIRDKLQRKLNLTALHSEYFLNKNLKAAFAYSECLLRPYQNCDDGMKNEAEKSMAAAAGKYPVAQIQYLRRYLEGTYGDPATAERCLGSLKEKCGTELIVKELNALILEKHNPGKNQSLWAKLGREHSVIALYYLGKYAFNAGDKAAASDFRFQFIEKNRLQNHFDCNNISWMNSGQVFGGYLEDSR